MYFNFSSIFKEKKTKNPIYSKCYAKTAGVAFSLELKFTYHEGDSTFIKFS